MPKKNKKKSRLQLLKRNAIRIIRCCVHSLEFYSQRKRICERSSTLTFTSFPWSKLSPAVAMSAAFDSFIIKQNGLGKRTWYPAEIEKLILRSSCRRTPLNKLFFSPPPASFLFFPLYSAENRCVSCRWRKSGMYPFVAKWKGEGGVRIYFISNF